MQRPALAAVAPRLLPWFALLVAALFALPALADPNTERQAQALQRKAIDEDSLTLNYNAAIKKLATAISKCGDDKCSPSLKGALYRDLGAILILSGSLEEGGAAFGKALSFDPSLDLDPAYKSPMLEGAWREARKKAGAGETGVPTEGGGAAQPTGDFAHVPAGSQLVRTPLPIYAEYVGTDKLVRVVVKYKSPGSGAWKSLELRKLDSGFGGLIPCHDVTEGTIRYYIQGYGTSDDPIAASGSRSKPFSVPIKAQLAGPAPSLPGQEPPKQCDSGGGDNDCPPDFPGCHAQKKAEGDDCSHNSECASGACTGGKCIEKKGEDDDCESDDECASGTCSSGKCTAPKALAGDSCDSDDDCASGSCHDGKCAEGSDKKSRWGKTPRLWIGVAGSLDLVSLPAAGDVCRLDLSMAPAVVKPVNTAGYQCVDPSTNLNFPQTPGASLATVTAINPTAGVADSVGGGLSPGNLRLMASVDYALNMNMLIGARLGYVLFTDPANAPGPAFAPIHAEARFTYLLGKDALASPVAAMLIAAVGVGEFDASIGVQAQLGLNGEANQGRTVNENAWIVAGPAFGAIGAGARFLLGSNIAATVVLKGEGAFGGTAGFLGAVAPEIGLQLGL